jgi:SHS2 domain-containing protein
LLIGYISIKDVEINEKLLITNLTKKKKKRNKKKKEENLQNLTKPWGEELRLYHDTKSDTTAMCAERCS